MSCSMLDIQASHASAAMESHQPHLTDGGHHKEKSSTARSASLTTNKNTSRHTTVSSPSNPERPVRSLPSPSTTAC
ncbi:unnamed protein product [Pleuronectes platessa]|uniref:Uncharacterized protein n=1 Tax=Pleuronectes platessa TaxID=8262 RepID=A0A9N7V6Q7_PLEPL|nr:unnamed protein product [Pleuronectes platessa]